MSYAMSKKKNVKWKDYLRLKTALNHVQSAYLDKP